MTRRLAILLTLLVCFPRSGGAASRSFPTLELPVSVRGAGMGSAPDGLEPNAFAARTNPAALGFVRGLNAGAMYSYLLSGFAPGLRLDFESAAVGTETRIGGIPLGLAVGMNRTYLDYANVPPGFQSWEFRSWESTTGGTVACSWGGVIGAGLGVKRWQTKVFDFEGPSGGAETGEATVLDYGLLARLPVVASGTADSPAPWTLFVDAALSWRNRGRDVRIHRDNRVQEVNLPSVRREGLGIDLALLPAAGFLPAAERWPWRVFRNAHLVSVSAAVARETPLVPRSSVALRGLEVRFLDSFSLRWGHVDDRRYDSSKTGDTFGWGLALGGLVGVDYARTPNYPGLEDVTRWGIRVQSPLETD